MSDIETPRYADVPGAATQPSTVEAIRRTWPMASPRTIDELVRAASVVRSNKAPILSEDERPSRVGLVLSGTVVATWSAPDGRVLFAGIYGPGQVVGLTTLSGGTITVGIDPLTPAVALTWDSRRFRSIADADPAMTGNLLDRAVFATHALNHLIKMRVFATASSRLAGLLIRYERLCFSEGRPLVPRSQLGALAGVTTRRVSRILHDWETAGIVARVGPSGLVLLDRDALAAEAAPLADFPPPDPTAPGAWVEPEVSAQAPGSSRCGGAGRRR
jgi:CRP-like cAMP-binding protein